ncbi:hypothetical protein ACNF40_06910 [Cuniculiplasma sp. SKW4]|uniref:hypothetical protein n=1 Tax=Cuniculiplasma sp. SKW4 TaxID=3400171 RepID=UPI003FD60A8E
MTKNHLSQRQKMVIAILSATMMILIPFAWFDVYSSHGSMENLTIGPKINIALPQNLSFNGNTNITENVQIMGANPSYFPSQNNLIVANYSLPSQGYVTLFNMTLFPKNHKNSFSGFLNFNRFSAIITGWQRYYQEEGYSLGTRGQEVSLQVEATLSILSNGNLSVYSYYNNMPFNPLSPSLSVVNFVNGLSNSNNNLNQWVNNTGVDLPSYSMISYIPYSFNLTPSYNMAKPTYVTNINASVQNDNAYAKASPNRIAPPPCYIGTKYIGTSVNVIHGPFPLLSIHDNATSNMTTNPLYISGSLATSRVTLCMTSDQTGVTAGGSITDQMSTNPSWGGDGAFINDGGIAQWHAYPLNSEYFLPNGTIMRTGINETTAMIYISNATFTVTHYNIYYSWKNSQGQCLDKYLGNATSIALTSIYSQDGNFEMGYGYVPIEYFYIMQNATNGEVKTNLGSLAPGAEISGGTIMGKTTGYSSAASEMTRVTSALKTFAAGLGVALAFITLASALNGADGDASEPAIVDVALATLDSVLELSVTLLTDFSSISFSTNSSFVANLYAITSGDRYSGYSYSLVDYQSFNPITFNANGGMYSFYGPSNFVVAS